MDLSLYKLVLCSVRLAKIWTVENGLTSWSAGIRYTVWAL